MQLVDRHVGGGGQRRRPAGGGPARRLQRRVGQTADPAAVAVAVEADGVGVGDSLAHQANTVHPDIDQVVVVGAGQVAGHPLAPQAGGLVEPQRVDRQRRWLRRAAGPKVAAPDPLGGWRPECELAAGLAVRRVAGRVAGRRRQDHHPQFGGVFGGGVQVIERARALQRCGLQHPAAAVVLHQQQLASVQMAQGGGIHPGRVELKLGAGGQMPEALLHGGRQWAGQCLQRERTPATAHQHARQRQQTAASRVVQPVTQPQTDGRGCRPLQRVAVQPDGAGCQLLGRRPQHAGKARGVTGRLQCVRGQERWRQTGQRLGRAGGETAPLRGDTPSHNRARAQPRQHDQRAQAHGRSRPAHAGTAPEAGRRFNDNRHGSTLSNRAT